MGGCVAKSSTSVAPATSPMLKVPQPTPPTPLQIEPKSQIISTQRTDNATGSVPSKETGAGDAIASSSKKDTEVEATLPGEVRSSGGSAKDQSSSQGTSSEKPRNNFHLDSALHGGVLATVEEERSYMGSMATTINSSQTGIVPDHSLPAQLVISKLTGVLSSKGQINSVSKSIVGMDDAAKASQDIPLPVGPSLSKLEETEGPQTEQADQAQPQPTVSSPAQTTMASPIESSESESKEDQSKPPTAESSTDGKEKDPDADQKSTTIARSGSVPAFKRANEDENDVAIQRTTSQPLLFRKPSVPKKGVLPPIERRKTDGRVTAPTPMPSAIDV